MWKFGWDGSFSPESSTCLFLLLFCAADFWGTVRSQFGQRKYDKRS